MAEVALDIGVRSSVILFEERSRQTAENAVEVARILRSRQAEVVLLVTHSTHMRQAVAAFRRARIAVRPAPTDGGEDRAASPVERVMVFFKVVHKYAAWPFYWRKGWV